MISNPNRIRPQELSQALKGTAQDLLQYVRNFIPLGERGGVVVRLEEKGIFFTFLYDPGRYQDYLTISLHLLETEGESKGLISWGISCYDTEGEKPILTANKVTRNENGEIVEQKFASSSLGLKKRKQAIELCTEARALFPKRRELSQTN